MKNFEQCGKNLPTNLDLKFHDLKFEKVVTVSGISEVSEKLPGPLSFSMESNQCSLDMKNCRYFNVINFKEICKKFLDQNPIYTTLFAKITPTLKCPIAPGNYTIEKTEINLQIFQFMPLDGYLYNTVMKLNSGSKNVWCYKTEVKIVKVRV
jgi:hypothetical protein